MHCEPHRDTKNVETLPGVQYVFLRQGREDPLNMMCHRWFEFSLDTDQEEGVDWSLVKDSRQCVGLDLAINHNEWLISFPRKYLHGTSNLPKYSTMVPHEKPEQYGFFRLGLPEQVDRIAGVYYLHKQMEESGKSSTSMYL